jgi:DNA-binding transcriptional ArsR family regulator
MLGEADIAAVAALLTDPTRVTILLTLSDGRAFPASELAKRAKVAPRRPVNTWLVWLIRRC